VPAYSLSIDFLHSAQILFPSTYLPYPAFLKVGMKFVVFSLVLLTSILATVITHSQTADPAPLSSHKPPNKGPVMIRVQAEFIEMPQASYTKLMAKPRTSTNDRDLRAHCTQLIEKKEARMIESLSVNALPGKIARTESIAEFTYPAELEYHQFSSPIKSSDNIPIAGTPAAPPIPLAYRTKNTGATLTLEAKILNDSNIVDLRITPTLIYHGGENIVQTWTNGEVTIENSRPIFYVLTAKTIAQLINGEPLMLSAHSPKNEEGFVDFSRKIMLFTRADIIQLTK